MSDASILFDEHSVLATFILPVAQALRQCGVDAMTVIEAAGIDPAGVINPDRRIPLSDMQALLHSGAVETGAAEFGLLAAAQLQPQVLHSLGLAWLASDTVLDGLRRTVRFSRLMSTGAAMSLVEEGDYVHVELSRGDLLSATSFYGEGFSVGILARVCRLNLGEFLAPVSLQMTREAPDDPGKWEYELCCPVTFLAPVTRLTYAMTDIREPLLTGDPELARANDELTQSYMDSFLQHSISREVVDKIVEKLPDGPPSQQSIAEAIHLSNRTLQRRLKDEGTSFIELLRDTRQQLALRYLRQPNRSIIETAYLLGFSEASTFSRAFKSWTGQAPAEFRRIATAG